MPQRTHRLPKGPGRSLSCRDMNQSSCRSCVVGDCEFRLNSPDKLLRTKSTSMQFVKKILLTEGRWFNLKVLLVVLISAGIVIMLNSRPRSSLELAWTS